MKIDLSIHPLLYYINLLSPTSPSEQFTLSQQLPFVIHPISSPLHTTYPLCSQYHTKLLLYATHAEDLSTHANSIYSSPFLVLLRRAPHPIIFFKLAAILIQLEIYTQTALQRCIKDLIKTHNPHSPQYQVRSHRSESTDSFAKLSLETLLHDICDNSDPFHPLDWTFDPIAVLSYCFHNYAHLFTIKTTTKLLLAENGGKGGKVSIPLQNSLHLSSNSPRLPKSCTMDEFWFILQTNPYMQQNTGLFHVFIWFWVQISSVLHFTASQYEDTARLSCDDEVNTSTRTFNTTNPSSSPRTLVASTNHISAESNPIFTIQGTNRPHFTNHPLICAQTILAYISIHFFTLPDQNTQFTHTSLEFWPSNPSPSQIKSTTTLPPSSMGDDQPQSPPLTSTQFPYIPLQSWPFSFSMFQTTPNHDISTPSPKSRGTRTKHNHNHKARQRNKPDQSLQPSDSIRSAINILQTFAQHATSPSLCPKLTDSLLNLHLDLRAVLHYLLPFALSSKPHQQRHPKSNYDQTQSPLHLLIHAYIRILIPTLLSLNIFNTTQISELLIILFTYSSHIPHVFSTLFLLSCEKTNLLLQSASLFNTLTINQSDSSVERKLNSQHDQNTTTDAPTPLLLNDPTLSSQYFPKLSTTPRTNTDSPFPTNPQFLPHSLSPNNAIPTYHINLAQTTPFSIHLMIELLKHTLVLDPIRLQHQTQQFFSYILNNPPTHPPSQLTPSSSLDQLSSLLLFQTISSLSSQLHNPATLLSFENPHALKGVILSSPSLCNPQIKSAKPQPLSKRAERSILSDLLPTFNAESDSAMEDQDEPDDHTSQEDLDDQPLLPTLPSHTYHNRAESNHHSPTLRTPNSKKSFFDHFIDENDALVNLTTTCKFRQGHDHPLLSMKPFESPHTVHSRPHQSQLPNLFVKPELKPELKTEPTDSNLPLKSEISAQTRGHSDDASIRDPQQINQYSVCDQIEMFLMKTNHSAVGSIPFRFQGDSTFIPPLDWLDDNTTSAKDEDGNETDFQTSPLHPQLRHPRVAFTMYDLQRTSCWIHKFQHLSPADTKSNAPVDPIDQTSSKTNASSHSNDMNDAVSSSSIEMALEDYGAINNKNNGDKTGFVKKWTKRDHLSKQQLIETVVRCVDEDDDRSGFDSDDSDDDGGNCGNYACDEDCLSADLTAHAHDAFEHSTDHDIEESLNDEFEWDFVSLLATQQMASEIHPQDSNHVQLTQRSNKGSLKRSIVLKSQAPFLFPPCLSSNSEEPSSIKQGFYPTLYNTLFLSPHIIITSFSSLLLQKVSELIKNEDKYDDSLLLDDEHDSMTAKSDDEDGDGNLLPTMLQQKQSDESRLRSFFAHRNLCQKHLEHIFAGNFLDEYCSRQELLSNDQTTHTFRTTTTITPFSHLYPFFTALPFHVPSIHIISQAVKLIFQYLLFTTSVTKFNPNPIKPALSAPTYPSSPTTVKNTPFDASYSVQELSQIITATNESKRVPQRTARAITEQGQNSMLSRNYDDNTDIKPIGSIKPMYPYLHQPLDPAFSLTYDIQFNTDTANSTRTTALGQPPATPLPNTTDPPNKAQKTIPTYSNGLNILSHLFSLNSGLISEIVMQQHVLYALIQGISCTFFAYFLSTLYFAHFSHLHNHLPQKVQEKWLSSFHVPNVLHLTTIAPLLAHLHRTFHYYFTFHVPSTLPILYTYQFDSEHQYPSMRFRNHLIQQQYVLHIDSYRAKLLHFLLKHFFFNPNFVFLSHLVLSTPRARGEVLGGVVTANVTATSTALDRRGQISLEELFEPQAATKRKSVAEGHHSHTSLAKMGPSDVVVKMQVKDEGDDHGQEDIQAIDLKQYQVDLVKNLPTSEDLACEEYDEEDLASSYSEAELKRLKRRQNNARHTDLIKFHEDDQRNPNRSENVPNSIENVYGLYYDDKQAMIGDDGEIVDRNTLVQLPSPNSHHFTPRHDTTTDDALGHSANADNTHNRYNDLQSSLATPGLTPVPPKPTSKEEIDSQALCKEEIGIMGLSVRQKRIMSIKAAHINHLDLASPLNSLGSGSNLYPYIFNPAHNVPYLADIALTSIPLHSSVLFHLLLPQTTLIPSDHTAHTLLSLGADPWLKLFQPEPSKYAPIRYLLPLTAFSFDPYIITNPYLTISPRLLYYPTSSTSLDVLVSITSKLFIFQSIIFKLRAPQGYDIVQQTLFGSILSHTILKHPILSQFFASTYNATKWFDFFERITYDHKHHKGRYDPKTGHRIKYPLLIENDTKLIFSRNFFTNLVKSVSLAQLSPAEREYLLKQQKKMTDDRNPQDQLKQEIGVKKELLSSSGLENTQGPFIKDEISNFDRVHTDFGQNYDPVAQARKPSSMTTGQSVSNDNDDLVMISEILKTNATGKVVKVKLQSEDIAELVARQEIQEAAQVAPYIQKKIKQPLITLTTYLDHPNGNNGDDNDVVITDHIPARPNMMDTFGAQKDLEIISFFIPRKERLSQLKSSLSTLINSQKDTEGQSAMKRGYQAGSQSVLFANTNTNTSRPPHHQDQQFQPHLLLKFCLVLLPTYLKGTMLSFFSTNFGRSCKFIQRTDPNTTPTNNHTPASQTPQHDIYPSTFFPQYLSDPFFFTAHNPSATLSFVLSVFPDTTTANILLRSAIDTHILSFYIRNAPLPPYSPIFQSQVSKLLKSIVTLNKNANILARNSQRLLYLDKATNLLANLHLTQCNPHYIYSSLPFDLTLSSEVPNQVLYPSVAAVQDHILTHLGKMITKRTHFYHPTLFPESTYYLSAQSIFNHFVSFRRFMLESIDMLKFQWSVIDLKSYFTPPPPSPSPNPADEGNECSSLSLLRKPLIYTSTCLRYLRKQLCARYLASLQLHQDRTFRASLTGTIFNPLLRQVNNVISQQTGQVKADLHQTGLSKPIVKAKLRNQKNQPGSREMKKNSITTQSQQGKLTESALFPTLPCTTQIKAEPNPLTAPLSHFFTAHFPSQSQPYQTAGVVHNPASELDGIVTELINPTSSHSSTAIPPPPPPLPTSLPPPPQYSSTTSLTSALVPLQPLNRTEPSEALEPTLHVHQIDQQRQDQIEIERKIALQQQHNQQQQQQHHRFPPHNFHSTPQQQQQQQHHSQPNSNRSQPSQSMQSPQHTSTTMQEQVKRLLELQQKQLQQRQQLFLQQSLLMQQHLASKQEENDRQE